MARVAVARLAAKHYNRIVRLLMREIRVELEVSIAARFYDADPMSYKAWRDR